MNTRRNFITACISGAAWVLGWKGEKPAPPKITTEAIQRMYARKYRVRSVGDGGFPVPQQYVSAIESGLPLIGAAYYVTLNKPMTMEEVCRARGIEYKPETEEEKAKRLQFVATMQSRFPRSKPCES